MSRPDYSRTLASFQRDTAEHQMDVLLDSGVYRHLRFSNGGSSVYYFDIVTWPGHLAISGDMGAAVFSRLPDMFEFFRADQRPEDAPGALRINAGYWAEKCIANAGNKEEFSSDLFEQIVREHFDSYMEFQDSDEEGFEEARSELWDEIEGGLFGMYDSAGEALGAAMSFKSGDKRFADFNMQDAWDWGSSVEVYTYHFIWRLYAIAYAVKAYDAAKAEVQA